MNVRVRFFNPENVTEIEDMCAQGKVVSLVRQMENNPGSNVPILQGLALC